MGEWEGKGGGEAEGPVPGGLFVDCFHFRRTGYIWWTFYEVLIEMLKKGGGGRTAIPVGKHSDEKANKN
jgi:hypothetical protein